MSTVTSGYTRRAFRHTHSITLTQGEHKDFFLCTPPEGEDAQAWAEAEVERRYGQANTKWGERKVTIHRNG